MIKNKKRILESFDFNNIQKPDTAQQTAQIAKNFRESLKRRIEENIQKLLYGSSKWFDNSGLDEDVFELHAIYKPKDEEELEQLLVAALNKLGFDCNLNWIDVSDIKYMNRLFYRSSFNGDISLWDVSNVKEMEGMFAQSKFNGNLSKWNTGSCENMSQMFMNSQFDGDISCWDVSNVRNMSQMFEWSKFNSDLSMWNTGNVWDMSRMFETSIFNGDISNWDVSKVEDMHEMFMSSMFNGDISNWDVSKVENVEHIFLYSEFDSDISKWNLSKDAWGYDDIRERLGSSVNEAFDFNAVKNPNKPISVIQHGIMPLLKKMKKGDAVYKGKDHYYIGEEKERLWDETVGYCAITAAESIDGIPRIIAAWDLKDHTGYDTMVFGGSTLYPPKTTTNDGKKNTQILVDYNKYKKENPHKVFIDPARKQRIMKEYEDGLAPIFYPYEFYAAQLCYDYSKDRKGLWYLPSLEELKTAFNTDEDFGYHWVNARNYHEDAPLLISSTIADDGISVIMYNGDVFRNGHSICIGDFYKPMYFQGNIRPFIKADDLLLN